MERPLDVYLKSINYNQLEKASKSELWELISEEARGLHDLLWQVAKLKAELAVKCEEECWDERTKRTWNKDQKEYYNQLLDKTRKKVFDKYRVIGWDRFALILACLSKLGMPENLKGGIPNWFNTIKYLSENRDIERQEFDCDEKGLFDLRPLYPSCLRRQPIARNK